MGPTDRPLNSISRHLAPWAFCVCLAPALFSVWTHRAFVTQDGPAHLYNAQILLNPPADVFQVRREPLPNWAGHLAAMGFVAILPPREADRAMTTLTLVAFAASVVVLRRQVAGGDGSAVASILASLLALNMAWLFGFGGFLLGASGFGVTLAFWWAGRVGGWSGRRALGLATLIILGYFGHVVSLGLTAVGLVTLELMTPGLDRKERSLTTALGLAPLGPLALLYLRLMRRGGGGFHPEWKHLTSPFSPRAWVDQLTWVDPISLTRKDYLPIVGAVSKGVWLLAPVTWLAVALTLAVVGTLRSGGVLGSERRGWWLLAALLLVGGLLGPDTLGASHGEYLQPRVCLLGLAALLPALRFDANPRMRNLCAVAAGLALLLQSAAVWEYGAVCDRTAGPLFRARGAVGRHRSVATLLTGIRTPYRANPLLHADCMLGVGTGNVIWSDYETRFYYFPVQFRPGLNHPDPLDFETIALTEGDPTGLDVSGRARLWRGIVERYHANIDTLLVWGRDPDLDAISARHYVVIADLDPVTVWTRRPETRDRE